MPDPDVRRSVLTLLASLIESANVEPSKWGVTLHANEVALNVGRGLYTFYLTRKSLILYWIGVPDEEEPDGTRASFKHFENSRAIERPAEELLSWFERLKPRLERFINHTNAIRGTALMAQSQRSHSPGVLRYLEEELGTTLPDPSYPATTLQTFTWIPFFADLTAHVLTYRDRQPELIDLLKQLQQQGRKIAPLNDQNAAGQTIPLLVHDPFTFFSHFCRGITFANQRAIFADLKSEWKLDSPIPTDLKGVPLANNQKAWFFSYESHRHPNDIDSLWDIAEQVLQGPDAITEEAWRNALHVRQVGLAKLTMGFFWLNPEAFLPLDQSVRGYLRRAGVTVPDPITLSQYRTLLQDARQRLGKSLPEISHDAFQNAPVPQPRYWAGGHYWSTGSRLKEFLQESAWWHGYQESDALPEAIQTFERFAEIQPGDYFAIKGWGGTNDLRVYLTGKVETVDEDTKRILIDSQELPVPQNIKPARGTGSWSGTLREVTDPAIIAWMFQQKTYRTYLKSPLWGILWQ